MSSGVVVVAPVGPVIAAGGAIVLAAGAAAVLVVYAANQAADGALRAVGRSGAALEAKAAARCAADEEALKWQAVAADVVGVNARLRLVAHRAGQTGTPVDLPPPLDLTGVRRDAAARWATDAERRLLVVQDALDAAVSEAHWRHLTATLPPAVSAMPDMAATLTAYRETLRRRRTAPSAPAAPVGIDAEVETLLLRLDPDASAEEQTTVLRTAALARGQRDRHDADAYVLSLRRLVDADVNVKVANRRAAAEWVQALEEPSVVAALGNADPPTPFGGTAARLAAVVEGRDELTPQLRAEAKDAVDWAFGQTRRLFIRDMIRSRLAEAGYHVGEELTTKDRLEISASRSDWHGEHSALLRVDPEGSLTGQLVREDDVAGDEAGARDRARCDDLHAVLESLPAGAAGMTVTITPGRPPLRRHRPGQPPETTVPQQRPTPRTHEKG